MLIFAQPSDVEAFTGEPAPDRVEPLIRSASIMVRHAVRAAQFDVTPGGSPSDPDVADALRDAVCAQVSYWDRSEVDPSMADTGAKVAKSSIGGATVERDTASAAVARDVAAGSLCQDAHTILVNEGLAGGHPWVH